MTQKTSRRATLAGLSAATLLAASGCGRQSSRSHNSVRIATAAGFNLVMSALMRQEKFLESFDLNPDVFALADGSKILSGIYSGSVDLTPTSGFGQVFPAIERGADLKIINAAALIPLLALFSAKSNVRTLKDLEGKVIGVGALGALDHQLTVTLLRKYSADVSAVRFIDVGSSTDIFKAVIAGTVDAGCGPASYVDHAEIYNAHPLENGDMSVELREFTSQAGWTSSRVIEAKRDLLVRVLAAYAKLFRFVQQPSAQDAFLRARRTIFPNASEREQSGEWNFLQRAKPFASDLVLSEERVRYLQQINLDFHIQHELLPFDRVADMSLARDALKLLT
jgi:ABC-type nitrate/sulfonate/bicarbonate transport system substrate-binding protein